MATLPNGKEIYADPRTGELTSRELAFASFEGLKNETETKVYIDQLRKKQQGETDNTNVLISNNSNTTIIRGQKPACPSTKKEPETDDLFDRELLKPLKQPWSKKKPVKEELSALPFPPFAIFRSIRNFIDKKQFWQDEEDREMELEREQGPGFRKKKLFILA